MITPGDAASPVLLHVPHAGTAVPAWVRRELLLSDAELAAEIAALTDHGTDLLALAAADRGAPRPWVIAQPLSRFVVDVERYPDGREEMAAVGMGAVYTHGTRGQLLRLDDAVHASALVERYFRPWGEAVRRLVVAGRTVLIDVHSYPRDALPYELHSGGARPEICLGTDAVHTPPWLVGAARAAFAGFEVGLDSPFTGAYAPTAGVPTAGVPTAGVPTAGVPTAGVPTAGVPTAGVPTERAVASLMLEIRRDVHAAREAELVAALAELVEGAGREILG